jgi:hypothetical protein
MINAELKTNLELNLYVYKHMEKTDHLMRDLLSAVHLAGSHPQLESAICGVREAIENCVRKIRV